MISPTEMKSLKKPYVKLRYRLIMLRHGWRRASREQLWKVEAWLKERAVRGKEPLFTVEHTGTLYLHYAEGGGTLRLVDPNYEDDMYTRWRVRNGKLEGYYPSQQQWFLMKEEWQQEYARWVARSIVT